MALTATIASGAALSDAVAISAGYKIGAIQLPATMTGTKLTFQQSLDGGESYADVHVQTGELQYTTAGGIMVNMTHDLWGKVKIRSGVATTPTNEDADRTITVFPIPLEV